MPAYARPAPLSAWTNWSWYAAAWAPTAWYAWPYSPNSVEIAVDTSSEAAAWIWAVGPATAAFAAPIADLMPAKSAAADATMSGDAMTNDMSDLPSRRKA
ncbi:hypothetical protein MHEI_10440 [Mycobacterium heidelbergense]|nr:hypothetical protein MHEI_10440 [Mycobacterium heidelbergense]